MNSININIKKLKNFIVMAGMEGRGKIWVKNTVGVH